MPMIKGSDGDYCKRGSGVFLPEGLEDVEHDVLGDLLAQPRHRPRRVQQDHHLLRRRRRLDVPGETVFRVTKVSHLNAYNTGSGMRPKRTCIHRFRILGCKNYEIV